eukprot:3951299-Pyramimonas_sp.AAC.1
MSHKPSALVNSPPQDRIRLALTNKPYKVGSHKQTDIASKDSGPPIAVRGPPIMHLEVPKLYPCAARLAQLVGSVAVHNPAVPGKRI